MVNFNIFYKIFIGRDHEEVMKKLGSIPDKLVYTIHVYFFTIGKNTFNMTIDEKI